MVYYQQNMVKWMRSDVLQIATESFNICIAGTHGKQLLRPWLRICCDTLVMGVMHFWGISVNYGTNLAKRKKCGCCRS